MKKRYSTSCVSTDVSPTRIDHDEALSFRWNKLENVTVRRLADALGVQAPTLYYHFADKQELLDWMAQAILSPVLRVLETDIQPNRWMEWLGIRAHMLRQAMLTHREGARVVAGAHFDRAEALAVISNGTIKGLLAAGFSLTQARLATKTLLSYLFGFVIEEQALAQAHHELETPLKEGSLFPLLSAALDEASSTGQNQQTDFEQGLQLFLAGMRAWLSYVERCLLKLAPLRTCFLLLLPFPTSLHISWDS